MKESLLVIVNKFLATSETFIYHQIKALSAYFDIYLVCSEFEVNNAFPTDFIKKTLIVNNFPKGIIDHTISYFLRKKNNPNYFPVSSIKQISSFIKENNIAKIHAHYGVNGVKLIELVKKSNKHLSLYVSFHGYDASRMLNYQDYIERLQELCNFNPTYIFCVPTLQKNLKQHNLLPQSSYVVSYGVDIEKIDEVAPVKKGDKVRIIHAGRLTPKKGVPDLVKVVCSLPKEILGKVELLIVGDGEDYEKVGKVIEENEAWDFVKPLGSMSHNELISYVKSADIFVLNSRISENGDSEGLPNAILEAMTCRVAVISTNHAGIPMAIHKNKTGLLIEEKDNEALRQALLLLIQDNSLRKKLGVNARKLVEEKFSMQKMQTQLGVIFSAD